MPLSTWLSLRHSCHTYTRTDNIMQKLKTIDLDPDYLGVNPGSYLCCVLN